jgi:hypothetical protein
MLEVNVAVHVYTACTCQCTQKFSQSGTYLVDNPVLDVEMYAGDWSIISRSGSEDSRPTKTLWVMYSG